MKTYILFLVFIAVKLNAQVVNCEEANYLIEHQGETYATFHYAKADYSKRSLQVFITKYDTFLSVSEKIKAIKNNHPKQDYTDFYVLGIKGFDPSEISALKHEIINGFLKEINQYRALKKLSRIDEDSYPNNFVRYLESVEDVCVYLICK